MLSWTSSRTLHPFTRTHPVAQARKYSNNPSRNCLRVLYCGSDDFSAVSLRKLQQRTFTDPRLIESIDVVCKKGKASGRGLKNVRDVPIKSVAKELKLPYHEISTFTGWQPPASVNLIIAVSFGLKVPPRILNGATHGGLNLHPSLLPDLRGPAPLQHALLEGRTSTGVTLQTLHPEHFDRGAIVAQQRFDIPNDGECSFKELYDYSAQVGADLLLDSLRNNSFLHPQPPPSTVEEQLTHARKITPEDAHVDWNTWSAKRVLCTQRALGSVWSKFTHPEGGTSRVQWHDLRLLDVPPRAAPGAEPGEPSVLDSAALASQTDAASGRGALTVIPTCDGHYLSCETVTIEGRAKHEAAARGVQLLLAGRV